MTQPSESAMILIGYDSALTQPVDIIADVTQLFVPET
jgi:hypothetical protein